MACKLIMNVEEMQADQTREKWLELRKTGLGGSDAGIIAGVNSFKTLFELWSEKTGIGADEQGDRQTPERAAERMRIGSMLEEFIANYFATLTGKKLRRCGMLRSVENPFMFANVDRLVLGENAILECKNTSVWNKDEWEGDNIPDSYYCQIQHYMAVGNYDKCYIAALIGGDRFVWKEVLRNEEDIQALITAEKEFWEEYVKPKKLPPPEGTDKYRKAISQFFKGGDKEVYEMSGELDGLCETIVDLKAQIKKLGGILEEKENKMRVEMGNHEVGRTPQFNISFTTIARTGYDTKKLVKDYPDIMSKYTKNSSYRALTITQKKEGKKRGKH